MLKNNKEKHWGSSGEIPESEIIKEVFKVGGIVLLFASIIPIIHTLYFIFAILIPEIFAGTDLSASHRISTNLNYLILDWVFVVIPFVIPAMIGKRLLFTEHREKIKWMPLMTGILCIIIGGIYLMRFLIGGF